MSRYYLDIYSTPDYFIKLQQTIDAMRALIFKKQSDLVASVDEIFWLIPSPWASGSHGFSVGELYAFYQGEISDHLKGIESLRKEFTTDERKEHSQLFIDKMHGSHIRKKVQLEMMRNKLEELFPQDKKNKSCPEKIKFRKTILDSLTLRIKLEQEMFELLEPYVSCYERNFGNMVLSNKKLLNFPLPEKEHNDLYEFYCEFFSENSQRFCFSGIDTMEYYNEMYILFFSSLDFIAEGELLKNESDTTPNAQFCEKVETFKRRLIERETLIKKWKIEVLKEKAFFNATISRLERLIQGYGTRITHHLFLKLIERRRLLDIKKEAEHEAKVSLEMAQIMPAVSVVEEKETTTTSSQNIFTVSEKIEIKQKDPVKEISMDSSRQASSDQALVTTEKSSPQEKEKTALKKPHPKPESKLPLKEEKKDASDFAKKSPALLAKHKLFKSEMSESKVIEKKPNKALRKILDKKDGNIFHNKLTVTQVSCAMKSLNGTFHNAKGGGSGQKGSLIGKKIRSVFFHRPHGGRSTLCPRAVKEFYQLIEHSQGKKKVKALPATQVHNKKEMNLRKGR